MIVYKILDWLVSEPDRNEVYKLVHMFIYNYKKYSSPLQLLQVLINYWSEPAHGNVSKAEQEMICSKKRTSVTFFLSGWFEVQYSDFKDTTLELLESFVREIPSEYSKPLVAKIQNVIKSKPAPSIYLFEASKEGKAKFEPGTFGFLDLKAIQVADQWTILDIKNFLQIDRDEYLRIQSDSNWDRMLKRAAVFSRWVASEIVQNVKTSKRVETIKRFVLIAMHFLENNNMNGLMCVWGGLNTISVLRLKKTKKRLPSQILDLWAVLEEKLSEKNNFGRLRKVTKKKMLSGEPVVPWFELVNKARNSSAEYDDYISTSTDPKIINFSKVYILGEQILNFEKYKKNLEKVDLFYESNNKTDQNIRTYLEHLPTYPDDVLWKMSSICEPD
uniref:Ras-GEF domain-containing protein n=1 Tax=Arcella intermedia TaxID=1963864 RepID=A0A6B2L1S2_9EUKA